MLGVGLRRVSALTATAALIAALVPATVTAVEDLDDCNGTYVGETFGDVTAQPGSECWLDDVIVEGNVHLPDRGSVEYGGFVGLGGGSIVKGNVHGGTAAWVLIFNSTVVGNVKAELAYRTLVDRSDVQGNVRVKEATTPTPRWEGVDSFVLVSGSTVHGDVTLDANEDMHLDGNIISGDCVAKHNGTVYIADNTVSGKTKGKCKSVKEASGRRARSWCPIWDSLSLPGCPIWNSEARHGLSDGARWLQR